MKKAIVLVVVLMLVPTITNLAEESKVEEETGAK